MKNKKVIVFGGSGFVGSAVADELTKQGNKVTIFDIKKSKYLNVKQKMIIGDITDLMAVKKSIKDNDYIYNFAAIGDISLADKVPIETCNINIIGNLNILESIKQSKKKYIFASTIYVYGNEGGIYRCSKQAAELLIEEYSRKYSLNYVILRFGSLYGPRSDKNNGLYKILFNSLKNKKVTYEGDYETSREYLHISDAAVASTHMLNRKFNKFRVNLTGINSIKVYDLLKTINEILGYKKNVKFVKSNNTNHYIRTPYNYSEKLTKKYFLNENVDLGQGILELLNYIKTSNKF